MDIPTRDVHREHMLLSIAERCKIVRGKLYYRPLHNATAMSKAERASERDALLSLMSKIHQVQLFEIVGYRVKAFNDGRFEGISLYLRDVNTDERFYLMFNVCLRRSRNTAYGKKGERFGNPRQFIPSIDGKLMKFLRRIKFQFPKKPSEIWKCMGQIKGLLLTGEVIKRRDLDKNNTAGFNSGISAMKEAVASYRQGLDKLSTSGIDNVSRQEYSTNAVDNDPDAVCGIHELEGGGSHGVNGVRERAVTGTSEYGGTDHERSMQEGSSKGYAINETERIRNQDDDDWLADYDNA